MVLAIFGCSSPAARFHRDAHNQGLVRHQQGSIVTYTNGRLVDGQPIHVYLDGDGTPTLNRHRIARDPTSRDRLILDLIDADPASSILIGRPCYYGIKAGCEPSNWTTARYSSEVVAHLSEAVNQIVQRFPKSEIVIIGYSGGGTLAMLAAPNIARVDTLVSVAANLDTEAWVDHHGYAPLVGSLNPADQPPLSPAIQQFHFFGEIDDNVPVALAQPVIERQRNAKTEVVAGFGHRCCWSETWTRRIEKIVRRVAEGT